MFTKYQITLIDPKIYKLIVQQSIFGLRDLKQTKLKTKFKEI